MKKPHTKKLYRLHIDGVVHKGSVDGLAEKLGFGISNIRKSINGYFPGRYGEEIGTSHPVYEFYRRKSGVYIATGTFEEVAEQTGLKVKSLTNSGGYIKKFTGEYRDVEDEDVITRRTMDRHAPVPTERKYDGVAVKKKIIVRPAAEKQFKVGEYAQYLHDAVFAKWNLKEGQ